MSPTTRPALRRALLIAALCATLVSGALAFAQPAAPQGGPTIFLPQVAQARLS